MCGRFSQSDPERIVAEFSVTGQIPRFETRGGYNIAPTQPVAVLRVLDAKKGGAAPSQSRTLDVLRWGLVPAWAKDPSVGIRMINARVETLAEKPAFRDALRLRRCLVVADGFYEWQKQGRHKQPYYIRRSDDHLIAMAGLWEKWTAFDGEIIETFTLITKPSVPPVTELHDRMPAILSESHHDAWLDAGRRETEPLFAILNAPSPALVAVPVSTIVNKPANDGPECIVPITPIANLGLFDR